MRWQCLLKHFNGNLRGNNWEWLRSSSNSKRYHPKACMQMWLFNQFIETKDNSFKHFCMILRKP